MADSAAVCAWQRCLREQHVRLSQVERAQPAMERLGVTVGVNLRVADSAAAVGRESIIIKAQ